MIVVSLKKNSQNTIGVKEPSEDMYSTWLRPEAGKPAYISSGSCSIHRGERTTHPRADSAQWRRAEKGWRLRCEWDLGKWECLPDCGQHHSTDHSNLHQEQGQWVGQQKSPDCPSCSVWQSSVWQSSDIPPPGGRRQLCWELPREQAPFCLLFPQVRLGNLWKVQAVLMRLPWGSHQVQSWRVWKIMGRIIQLQRFWDLGEKFQGILRFIVHLCGGAGGQLRRWWGPCPQRGSQVPWSWSSQWLWDTYWGTGNWVWVLCRSISALTHWIISPAPEITF